MTGKYDTPTRLAELRSAKNMSQNDLAKRLGTTGQSVGRYEKEPQRLSVPLLRQIAKELGATVAEIVGETPPDANQPAGTREPLKMLKPPKLARAASNAPPTRGRGGDQVPRATVSLAGWPSRGGRSSPPKTKVDPMTSSASNPGRESAG